MIKEYLADEDFVAFSTKLEKLLANISEIRKTPMNEREYKD